MKTIEQRLEEIISDTTGRKIMEIVLEIAKQFGEEKTEPPADLASSIYSIIENNYPCIEYTVPGTTHFKTFVLSKGSSFGMIRNDGKE